MNVEFRAVTPSLSTSLLNGFLLSREQTRSPLGTRFQNAPSVPPRNNMLAFVRHP